MRVPKYYVKIKALFLRQDTMVNENKVLSYCEAVNIWKTWLIHATKHRKDNQWKCRLQNGDHFLSASVCESQLSFTSVIYYHNVGLSHQSFPAETYWEVVTSLWGQNEKGCAQNSKRNISDKIW